MNLFVRPYEPGRPPRYAVFFDPGTVAIASLALGGLSTASSVAGGIQQGQAQAAQANYQSQVARNNQILAQRNATLATQEGEVQAQDSALKTQQIEGSQKAALASQGGDIDTGSNAGIIADTASAGQTDQETIRYNANLKAYGYEVQASGDEASAENYSTSAANATAALPFGVGSTLLGGASTGAGKWYQYMTGNNANPGTGPGTGYTY